MKLRPDGVGPAEIGFEVRGWDPKAGGRLRSSARELLAWPHEVAKKSWKWQGWEVGQEGLQPGLPKFGNFLKFGPRDGFANLTWPNQPARTSSLCDRDGSRARPRAPVNQVVAAKWSLQ